MDFGKPEPIKPIEEDSEENDKEQQNIETVDSDLPIEIIQEDIDETLECLQSLSPDEKEALDKAILKAQEEKANFGEISPETENTLTEQITAAVIKTLKVGSEVKLEKLIEKLGPEYEKKLIRLLSNPETLATISPAIVIARFEYL